MGAPGEFFALRPFCRAFSLVGASYAAGAGVLRRRRVGGGRSARLNSASRSYGRFLRGGGATARSKRGSASLVDRRPVWRGCMFSGYLAALRADVSCQPCGDFVSLFLRCSGILLRVAHASGAQDDPSGPLLRGEASAAVPFWYFGGWALSRAALATWIRHQSVPETTDRDSAQRWPRRNPHALRHVGARLGVPHRARLGRDGRGGRDGQRS